ncbi:MAG TPA: carboxypeptidase-like regulatory domain-containing protein [Thermoanaerobaculia bacterium]|nr:carboxypeptidase-like regulatory domain-containing protein [Thermoanaerobaculia bacterium]
MIAALLAAVLALPPGAEAIRIGNDAWPEKVSGAREGEKVWWWSQDCAPTTSECMAPVARRVQVVDGASGKKLPGARVIWGTDGMRTDLPDALLPFAITDAGGEAVLRLPKSAGVSMRVDGPRAASWWQSVTPGDVPVRLAAVPASPSPVQLTIGGNEPATRAVVQLESSGIRSWAVAYDGRITLPALPAAPVQLVAWSEASAPLVMEIDLARLPRTIDLPRGASVRGRVIDARRHPIEGAAVEAVVPIGTLARGLRRYARSTRAGTFVLRGTPAGALQVKIRQTARATVVRRIEADGDVDAGDITLRPARQIAVRVLDAEGAPVAGATARAAGSPSATTGRDGIARIDSVAAGEDVTVTIAAKGFRATDIEVASDAKFPLDVTLSRGVRLVGRIVDAKRGEPAGPGNVLLDNNGGRRIVAFDESGLIDIGGLDAGQLAVEIRAHEHAPRSIDTRSVAADETWDLGALSVEPGAVLAGRVIDADRGDPVAAARIRVLRGSDLGAALAAVMNDWIGATSNDDGSFSVRGLTSGSHVALVEAPGFAPRVLTFEADAEAVEVKLDRARGLAIDCAPVRRCGTEARLLYAGSVHPWASTSATMQDGKARILTAAPGTALLRLVQRGEIVHEREVQIGAAAETTVEIRLGTATLRGTVASAGRPRRDGGRVELRARTAPSAGLPVYLERRTPDGHSLGGGWQTDLPAFQAAEVDGSGNFEFPELDPGEYEATYRREGIATTPVKFHVRPGTSHFVLQVAPGELRGRVLREDGAPAAFAAVRIIDAAGLQAVAHSDRLGNFEMLGIAEGRAALIAADEHAEASAEVEVGARGPAVVEMVMRPKTR